MLARKQPRLPDETAQAFDSTLFSTIKEVAELTRRKEQTIHNLMSKSILKLGKHYHKPNGGHPLFKRSEIIRWIEGEL